MAWVCSLSVCTFAQWSWGIIYLLAYFWTVKRKQQLFAESMHWWWRTRITWIGISLRLHVVFEHLGMLCCFREDYLRVMCIGTTQVVKVVAVAMVANRVHHAPNKKKTDNNHKFELKSEEKERWFSYVGETNALRTQVGKQLSICLFVCLLTRCQPAHSFNGCLAFIFFFFGISAFT